MPSMYDMMYGGGTPNMQQGYQRAYNSPMTQYGLRMMQGQNPFAGAPPAPAQAQAQAQAQTQPQIERSPSGRRRIRIGNKVYEEVIDDQELPVSVLTKPLGP